MNSLISKITVGLIFVIVLVLIGSSANGQGMVFSITEDNDFFTGTDRYFTNGLHIEVQIEKLKSSLNGILPAFTGFETIYHGVGITQNIYTPTNKVDSEYLQNDLPYSGTLFASLNRVSVNTNRSLRLNTEIIGGLLGPHAYSGEVQAGVHRLIHNKVPRGWNNQLPSDLIINYRFELIKTLLQNHYMALQTNASINTGTILNDIGAGVLLKTGMLHPAMQDLIYHGKQISVYFFGGISYTYVISNRLLSASHVSRIPIARQVYSYQYGLEVSFHSFKLAYTLHAATRQRIDIEGHRYGSITLAFRIV